MYYRYSGAPGRVGGLESKRQARIFPATSAELSHAAQEGEAEPAAKPMWRTVYTVRFAEGIYALHAPQKKPKSGTATPKRDVELIKLRLAEAKRLHREGQN